MVGLGGRRISTNFQAFSDLSAGADPPGGPEGHVPSPGGREVPQLIEGSDSCQTEVKASKSDKHAPQLLGKCAPHWLCPPVENSCVRPCIKEQGPWKNVIRGVLSDTNNTDNGVLNIGWLC